MFFSTSSTWQSPSSPFKAQFKYLPSQPFPRFSLNLVDNSYCNISTLSSKFLDLLIYCTILCYLFMGLSPSLNCGLLEGRDW